jgi:predicted SAM-dependent methyltransferase
MKLKLGSRRRENGWHTFDAVADPGVDFVGDIADLSRFAANSIEAIYASHVLEHIGFIQGQAALKEWFRVLVPGGEIMISVPDIEILSSMMISERAGTLQRFEIMKMMFGGQEDDTAYHKVGYFPALLAAYVGLAGFVDLKRVASLGLFKDASEHRYLDMPISLNVTARKPLAA